MKSFEYKFLIYSTIPVLPTLTGFMPDWDNDINSLGRDGWELVGIENPSVGLFGTSTFVQFVFKRLKTPTTESGQKADG